jgi:6-phosphofructokinase 1
MLKNEDLRISHLGKCEFPSPQPGSYGRFVGEVERVLVSPDTERGARGDAELPCFERAGPRAKLFFDPSAIACGIVTCGGLCPGLNDVIRSVVMTLSYSYGVGRIYGFRFGFAGLSADPPAEPVRLTPDGVKRIHEQGGTILGSSRGPQDVAEMVETLVKHDIGVLFCVGGDGTLRGASALAAEIAQRDLRIAVIGIPKTIDNDLLWVQRSFGFSTAVEKARTAIQAAHVEAEGAWNGIGLVKLMGRHSGFIAAESCLANNDANFCLIPEVPFTLEGRGGFLDLLEQRLRAKRHAVIVVAEGAGQDLLEGAGTERDASGNVKLQDIGRYLHDRILDHLRGRGMATSVKYIDPSYMIRSLPAVALDSEFCLILGQHAVHAGMSGHTEMVVGFWNQRFTHVPIRAVAGQRNHVDPRGALWARVLEAIGQPATMIGE